MSNTLVCWLSIGSTYTYLTSQRLRSALNQQVKDFIIKPFNIRKIMIDMENIPFPRSKSEKVDYMWKDIQRRALKYEILIPETPVPYPLKNFDLSNLIGVLAAREGWYLDYFETTYQLWFINHLEAGSEENLKQTLLRVGKDFDETLKKANSGSVIDEYEQNTSEAKKNKIFGAPSFQVGGDIFWGDDRLEDAIDYCKFNND